LAIDNVEDVANQLGGGRIAELYTMHRIEKEYATRQFGEGLA